MGDNAEQERDVGGRCWNKTRNYLRDLEEKDTLKSYIFAFCRHRGLCLGPSAIQKIEALGSVRLGTLRPFGGQLCSHKLPTGNRIQEALQFSFDPLNVSRQQALKDFLLSNMCVPV